MLLLPFRENIYRISWSDIIGKKRSLEMSAQIGTKFIDSILEINTISKCMRITFTVVPQREFYAVYIS